MTFILLLLVVLTMFGQQKGFIDYQKAIETLPQYQVEKVKIDAKIAEFRYAYDSLINFYSTGTWICGPVKDVDTAIVKTNAEAELKKLENLLIERGKNDNRILEALQGKIDSTLRVIVVKELHQFKIDKQINLVVDKKSVLYCSECTDFTADFIEYWRLSR